MILVNHILVKVKSHSKDQINLGGGKSLLLATGYNTYDDAICSGIITEVPKDFPLEVGTEIIFEKGITRKQVFQEDILYSDYLFDKDNLIYRIPIYENFIVAYKKGVEWKLFSNLNLLEPIKANEVTSESGVIHNEVGEHDGYIEHLAKVSKYSLDSLKSNGLKEGDKVVIKPYRSFIVDIDGKDYFALRTKHVLAKI